MDGFSIETLLGIILALVFLAALGFFVLDILVAGTQNVQYTGFHNWLAEATGWELT